MTLNGLLPAATGHERGALTKVAHELLHPLPTAVVLLAALAVGLENGHRASLPRRTLGSLRQFFLLKVEWSISIDSSVNFKPHSRLTSQSGMKIT
jgi:hypothetical protein